MLELTENRVWRPFTGGKLLDQFSGSFPGEDSHYPERWICSATGSVDGKGISRTKDGILLTDLYKQPVDILVKLLDSRTRLMIQVHPDDARAQKYFASPLGKTECWYILDTRTVDGREPYVYLGFREGVTRQKWEELYRAQDIAGMEQCLHKIPVQRGDAFFVPGGVVHAMGSGVFFAEVQQPTDITLRTEWVSPDGRNMDASGIHGGAGEEALFDCFDYDGCSLEETLARYRLEPQGDVVVDNHLFRMLDVRVSGSYTVKVNSFAIAVVLEGPGKGKEFFLTEDTVFTGEQRLLICTGARRSDGIL